MVWHGLTSFFARIKITILGHAFPDGGQPCPRHHTNPECNETMVGQRKKAPTARGTSFTSPVPRDARSWVDRWWVEVGNMSESGQNNEVCDGLCRKWSSLRLAGWLRNPRSAKFTLNSKRFPRLKSTFPLWLNLSVLASLHSKRISALVPFLSRPQAIRTSPLPPFGLNFDELSLSSLQQRSGLQRLGDAEKTFQGLKSFFLFPGCLFYKRICRGSVPPKFDPREEKLQQQHQDTPLHLKF